MSDNIKIQLTPLQMINALRFGYHTDDAQEQNQIVEELDISKDEAEKILIDKVCNYIGKLDPPIVVLVSGGVDSTFMCQMAEKCFSVKQLMTMGMDYPNAFYSYNSDKKWINETLDLINPETYKEVFFSSSLVVTQTMYGLAKNHGNVILTGDGGDELFCGYDKYLLPSSVCLAKNANRRIKKLINYSLLGYEGAMITPIDLSLFEIDYPRIKKERMIYDIAHELKYIEIPKVETAMRMSETVGRVHSPFLNKDIFDFCLSLPLKLKYHFGVRKVLLRRILKKNGIHVSHKKTGFALMEKWIGNELNWSLMVLDRLIKQEIVKIVSAR